MNSELIGEIKNGEITDLATEVKTNKVDEAEKKAELARVIILYVNLVALATSIIGSLLEPFVPEIPSSDGISADVGQSNKNHVTANESQSVANRTAIKTSSLVKEPASVEVVRSTEGPIITESINVVTDPVSAENFSIEKVVSP